MNNKTVLIFPLLFFILGLLPLQSQQCFSITEDIVVAENEVQNNVVSFGGDVLIEGKVREGVVTFGSEVTISGEVGEVVLGFGSNVTLKSTAYIKGDVFVLGGKLTKEVGCTIEGDTVYFRGFEDLGRIFSEGWKGAFIPFLIAIKLISVFITFLLALLITALFPRQIAFASNQVRKSFWPVVGTGALSIVIYVGLVIFSTLLSLLLIGIPILLSLVIIGFVIKIFGRVILFHFFGESLINAFGKTRVSPFLAVVVGLVIVSFISFIPILGGLFTFCLSIIGWGVVIRTKFGTTENWFKKRSEAS